MPRLLPFLLCTATTLAYPPGFTQYLTDFPLEQADPAETRTLGALPVPGGLSARGTFYKDAADGLTVDGAAEFTQNFLSGTNSRYTIWIRGPNMEGGNFAVGFADDCLGTNYVQLNNNIVAPLFMPNGFYVKGVSSLYNVDTSGSKLDLNDYHVVVRKAGTTVNIGCTANKLI